MFCLAKNSSLFRLASNEHVRRQLNVARSQSNFSNKNFKSLDPKTESVRNLYAFMTSAIVPRPIALVSTKNNAEWMEGNDKEQGKESINVAPFSYFNAVSTEPPCIMFSITQNGNKEGGKKDTLRNIQHFGEFVVHSVNEENWEKANQTSGEYPYGHSELREAGFTTIPSSVITTPRIAESSFSMECKLEKIVELGEGGPGSVSVVFGRIVMFHIDESILNEKGRIDPQKLKPVARLGGISYGTLGKVLQAPRPSLNEDKRKK
eukprot:TRINITY_DN6389_c0_g1_i1.p1 TRINITY_DN6389_c0_g1~~TRINITY_DN6389_c0_g1_i1.p1  ORF type:complete len:263 (-),score=71.99 TRINITY_DN6389_c0_g1_i1:223-1011(-)